MQPCEADVAGKQRVAGRHWFVGGVPEVFPFGDTLAVFIMYNRSARTTNSHPSAGTRSSARPPTVGKMIRDSDWGVSACQPRARPCLGISFEASAKIIRKTAQPGERGLQAGTDRY